MNGKMWLLGHCNYRGDNCLPWPGSTSRGYGQVGIGGRRVGKAHRVMCELAHGAPPSPKHEAAHTCGNRECVNPKHLAWKTRGENQRESVAMGRAWRGGRRGKLTRDAALRIRALKGLKSQDKIAKEFGITHSTVAKIHRGHLWRS